MRLGEIVAVVIGLLGAVASSVSCGAEAETAAESARFGATEAHALYLNFDGALLQAAPPYDRENGEAPNDDATQNLSSVVSGPIPAFDASLFATGAKDRIVELVRGYLAPFAIDVVTTRPSGRPYTMIVVGGRPTPAVVFAGGLGAGARPSGIAALDCGNRNPNGVGVAFAGELLSIIASDDFATFAERPVTDDDVERAIAATIVHEAGHSWGLLHVDTASSLMHYWINNIVAVGDEDWLPGPVIDSEALVRACRGPTARPFEWIDDPRAVLLATFGARTP